MSSTEEITITSRAAKEVKSVIKDAELTENSYLRVGVKGGGCSGFQYVLDITDTKKEKDIEFIQHDITIICDEKSLMYLTGTEIGFEESLMGRGFTFKNPNSSSSCGCGSSFSAD